MKRILFTGGGSAGHVVPNLAIMRELRYTHELLYMGTGGIEKSLVRNAGYEYFQVDCPKLVRSLTLKNFKIPFQLRAAKHQALEILQTKKPDLVFSKGGYVSYPAVWAAHKLGIPVLTHESDLSAGLCTKLIAKKCNAVLTSFPETAAAFKNGVYTGSPVRKEILDGERMRARRKFDLPASGSVLLVFGGGSGSRALNTAVENSLSRLLEHFSILHITGKQSNSAHAIARHSEPPQGVGESPSAKSVYIQREFESDMGSVYAAADVILARAGSNTVFEILALKKRAVLVPLAKASRGDQVENACYFERKGLVKMLLEEELSTLAEVLIETEKDPILGKNLANSNIPSGTDTIIQLIKKTLESTL